MSAQQPLVLVMLQADGRHQCCWRVVTTAALGHRHGDVAHRPGGVKREQRRAVAAETAEYVDLRKSSGIKSSAVEKLRDLELFHTRADKICKTGAQAPSAALQSDIPPTAIRRRTYLRVELLGVAPRGDCDHLAAL